MTTSTSHRVPAGWYHDPAGSGHPRWWDGAAWTEHLLEDPSPAEPEQSDETAVTYPTRRQLRTATGASTIETGSNAATWAGAADPGTGTAPIRTLAEPAESTPVPTSGAPHNTFGALTPGALEAVMARIEERGSFTPLAAPSLRSAGGAELPARDSRPAPAFASPQSEDRRARPDATNTLSAWTIAAMPLLYPAVMVAIVFALDFYVPAIRIGATAIFALWTVLLAVRDARELKHAGHESVASPAWMLLSPLVYLILRARRLHARTGHGYGPVTVWIVLVVLQFALILAAPVLMQLWV